MNLHRQPPSRHAFTLMELLVVIAIIAVVASLVVGMAGTASEKKKQARVKTERDRLVLLIEAYRLKMGVLPPHNVADPGRNSLFYELAGATRDIGPNPANPAANPTYRTVFSNVTAAANVRADVLQSSLQVGGILNAYSVSGTNLLDGAEDITEYKRFLKTLKPDQYATIWPNTISLVVPVDGPQGRGQPNPWKYLVGNDAVHNKNSFDLWADVVISGKTNRIGNWKD